MNVDRCWVTRAAALAAVCGILGVAMSACAGEETGNAGRRGEPRVSAYAPDDSAEDIFRARCKPCHGEDGKHRTKMGELHPMPDFTDPDWQGSRSDPEIRRIIEEGSTRPGSPMVGFAKRLAPAEMDVLVPYVRHFGGR